jgi:hypothetical protein
VPSKETHNLGFVTLRDSHPKHGPTKVANEITRGAVPRINGYRNIEKKIYIIYIYLMILMIFIHIDLYFTMVVGAISTYIFTSPEYGLS